MHQPMAVSTETEQRMHQPMAVSTERERQSHQPVAVSMEQRTGRQMNQPMNHGHGHREGKSISHLEYFPPRAFPFWNISQPGAFPSWNISLLKHFRTRSISHLEYFPPGAFPHRSISHRRNCRTCPWRKPSHNQQLRKRQLSCNAQQEAHCLKLLKNELTNTASSCSRASW